ncbi:MAG TPA: MFS transporter [Stellaceae bacterium]|nr:MFS transporter [Stellaceae bacterium]
MRPRLSSRPEGAPSHAASGEGWGTERRRRGRLARFFGEFDGDRGPGQSAARSWALLAFFTLLWLFCYVDVFIIGALLTPIKADLRLTDQQLGQLHAATIVAYVAIVPLAGYLGDRLARKWIIFASILLLSAASIGSGFAGGFTALLAWRALAGVGDGAFATLSQTWIADVFGPKHRAFAFAVIMSTGQFAATVAYALGGAVAAQASWHEAFVIAALPALVLGLAVGLLREPRRTEADGSALGGIPKPTAAEIGDLLKTRNYQLYLAAYVFRLVAIGGWFFWSAVLLQRRFGISNQEAVTFIGSTYLLTGAPGIFLSGLVAGHLARRVKGAFTYWLVAGDVLAGTTVSVILLGRHGLAATEGLLLVQTFFAGFTWGVIATLLFEIVPARVRNTAVSLAMVAQNLGSAFLASVLIGAASDRFGIGQALLVIPAGYFIAGAFATALLIRQVRESALGEPLAAPLPERA